MFANGICAFHIVFGLVAAINYFEKDSKGNRLDGGIEKYYKPGNKSAECKALYSSDKKDLWTYGRNQNIRDRYEDSLKWLMFIHAICAGGMLLSIGMRTCNRNLFFY